MKRFGEKIRILRQRTGLTQKELGEVLGVNHTHVARLESSQKLPHASMILDIARFFNVSTDQLMKDELELEG